MKFSVFLMACILVLPSAAFGQNDSPNYTLEVVGGEDVTIELDGVTIDGISVGTTSVRSTYPDGGIVVAADLSSKNAALTEVKALAKIPSGITQQVDAMPDRYTGQWVAELFRADNHALPWRDFEFQWWITDESGTQIFTEPMHLVYWDPTREWYRLENDFVVMYWFGVEEVNPEYIAETMTEIMAVTEEIRRQAFGIELNYKPIAIVYGTREATAEYTFRPMSMSGLAEPEMGMTLQTFGAPDNEWFEQQANCIHLTPRVEQTQRYLVDKALHVIIPHEITHLYQAAVGISGPGWWREGQATYFTIGQGIYDVGANERINQLSQYQDLNSFQYQDFNVLTLGNDGCYAVGYDAGTSFIDFLVENHGELETHLAIVEAMQSGLGLGEALEAVTGKTFLELENEWRAIYGYRALTRADLDPTSLLTDAIDPVYVKGDKFDIPGPLPLSLNESPGRGAIPSGTVCQPATQANVVRVGSIDGVNYYELDCLGRTGWVSEEMIS